MLVYPTNSAGPERIFSEVALLKTKNRNRLEEVTLNNLIHIRKNCIEMEELDFASMVAGLSQRVPKKL